jgi:predicted nucleotidyltransferase
MMFGLTEHELSLIRAVFARSEAVTSVAIYGSRALGTEQPASDIDLALQGPGTGDNLTLGRLAEELDALPLPYQFDLCWRDALEHEGLQEHIRRFGRVVYERQSG